MEQRQTVVRVEESKGNHLIHGELDKDTLLVLKLKKKKEVERLTKKQLAQLIELWRTKLVSMQDLATKFEISRERVRQLLARAREKDATIPTHSQKRG